VGVIFNSEIREGFFEEKTFKHKFGSSLGGSQGLLGRRAQVGKTADAKAGILRVLDVVEEHQVRECG
jgi:hypothetical protein